MWARYSRAAAPVLLAFTIVLVLFAGYEFVEARWLAGLPYRELHVLHRLRGVILSLVAALLAAWLILRTSPQLLDAPLSAEGEPQGRQASGLDQRQRYARWFIHMRWTAIIVAATLAFVSASLLHMLPDECLWPLLGAVAVLAALNILYGRMAARPSPPPWLLELQAYADLMVLTILLHFSGGVENPLAPIMLIHVIIAGIIVSRRQCYMVAAAATLLFSAMAAGEWSEVVEHYTLTAYPHEVHEGEVLHAAHYGPYVVSRVALHGALLFLTAFFATTLAARIRDDERELERFAERLQEELENQKRAQRMLVRAERLAAVGELAGKVAHEVNNPIAVISAKGRLLLTDDRSGMSPHTEGEIGKIVELADRVARIASGLLSYGRPSPAVRSRIDAHSPVRRALAYVAHAAAAQGVSVNDRLPATLPPVQANDGELEQVFLNLFLNALDAMPGGGTLTVSASGEERTVAVHVEDTGCGIPPEIRERVFEPFWSTKADGKGTGLGLSICSGLIRSHGGRIELDSTPGAGTRFTIVLPVAEAESAVA